MRNMREMREMREMGDEKKRFMAMVLRENISHVRPCGLAQILFFLLRCLCRA